MLAPGHPAVSYAHLLTRVDAARLELQEAGIGRGDRVATVLPNGPEAAITFLSIASVAACAPLNPAYRKSEYSFYLSDLAPKAIVLEQDGESAALLAAGSLGIPVIRLRSLVPGQAATFASSVDSRLSQAASRQEPDDVALVLHTSGTTSRPKQVPLTHRNLCRSARNIRCALNLTASDRCLNVMPLFHIHGLVAAVLASLSAGASVVCTPGFFAPQFLDWLAEYEPTWYSAVPTMHQAILARAGDQPQSTSLRFIRSSSAPLPPQVMTSLERIFSVPVIEAYGMTEAAHQMASNPLPPHIRKPGSVGRAAGPEIAIMNNGRLLASGVTGEIVIRGENVMAGYVANPEANRDSFWDGWFRTGDLGRLDDENYLFISGRTKEIINRGGEKISPREVDEALLEHPSVAQALAFAMPHPKLGEEVAAAVVLKARMTADEATLREFASERLADFKVPIRVLILDEIPKGPTGKPQRIGLAAMLGLTGNGHAAPAVSSRREPSTASEKQIAFLWQQVLGIAEIHAGDNFFDLGGDSMLAAQFLSRLAQLRPPAPPLLRLFDHPTVESFASLLDASLVSNLDAARQPDVSSLILRDPSAPPALSFAQQRFWFLHQFEENGAAYVQSSAFRLRGSLDIDKLRRAFNQLVDRHEILRTNYQVDDGLPVPILRPAGEVDVKTVSISIDALHDLAASEARQSFDLSKDLMIRPVLARIAPGDHVLLLSRHHIASDGWSAEVLLRELAAFYQGAALPAPSLQYSDFARWQTRQYESGAFDEDIAYWKDQLDGAAPTLALPLDRLRPPRQSFNGARESFSLEPALALQLNQFARTGNATLFMVLLAAFQALLQRYSSATDIAVGCPVAGRTRVELETLLGPVMNTLVLRSDLSRDPSFHTLVASVRSTTLSALAHQGLPFDKLVDALQPARSLSHAPFFQVLFQLRNWPFEPACFRELECEPLDVDTGVAQFDLSLEIVPAGGGLHCTLAYNTDLFDRDTAFRISRHYRNLLASALRDPAVPLSTLPVLDPEERLRLLSDYNPVETPLPSLPVHQQFEHQAARTPGAIAIVDRDGEYTYSELNSAASALAERLRSMGIDPGALVAVCVERSLDMAVALLGILKAGAAYLPLDPSYPAGRRAFMLEDSGACALVTSDGVEALGALADLPPFASRTDTAYSIYTSGSTGTPKAVLVPHSALANTLQAMRGELDVGEGDTVVAVTTLSFDIAAVEIFLPLITGGKLVIAGREQQLDGRALHHLVTSLKPTWLQATPATWSMLLEAGWTGDPALTAICGGETMPRPLAESLLAQCARVFNAYGPTETTIWSTIGRVRSGSGPVPIGRPLANNRLYILDSHLEPVPLGVAGHLYIGGAGVAQGYWRRPELTAERFLPDLFAVTPGARMYNTGDLARWLPGGTVEFLGRSDHQVKLRGFRIELGEVEAALVAHSGVQAAAVVLRDDALIAWCVWRDEAVESGSLRLFLAQRLPAYMLPSQFIGLPALPSLPNGKIDRKALSSLSQPLQNTPAGVAPVGETERRIAAIWEELLERGPIGRSDDFFELGGNSLLAARAAARIDHAFGIRVPIAAIFEAPTVATLAGHIQSGAQPVWPPGIIPIQPNGTRLPFWAVGGAASYRAFAQHLGADQPVLGVLLEDSDALKLRPPYTVEAISGEMVQLLRRQQLHGPYYLAGHSRYGVFALEAARQLLALGEEVPLLAIFDANLPKSARMAFPLGLRARIHIAATSWLLAHGRYRDAMAFILDAGIDLATRRFRTGSEPALDPSIITQRLSITEVLDLAAANYQPQPYSQSIVYLQAADQPIALELGSRLGWSDWTVGGLDVRIVPGTHTTLLEPPHVAAVAHSLADLLPQGLAATKPTT